MKHIRQVNAERQVHINDARTANQAATHLANEGDSTKAK